MSLTVLVFAAFGVVPLVAILARTRAVSATAILPATLFVGLARYLPEVGAGTVILDEYAWAPSLGATVAFRADGLSLLFALLITGIGCCVFLYAARYLSGDVNRPAFFTCLTLFMASMLGAVLAENLVALLVFWELTSLTSFLLIGFEHQKSQARRSAQQSLLITVAGGLALTAAILLLGDLAGSYSFQDLLSQDFSAQRESGVSAVMVLVALAAFTKSAQTPFHFWLPNAMVAPTPVSAYLHSATMVKLGVYLVARFNPLFRGQEPWMGMLCTVGAMTMTTSAVLLLRETDLKRILAYSTTAALGMMVWLIGIPDELAAMAVVTLIVAHALYKACLFLVAGIVDHESGTRNAMRLGGLRHQMPWTAAIATVAALSMAGIPPLIGFVGKELAYESGSLSPWSVIASGIAFVASVATVVAALIVAWQTFWGPPQATPQRPHDPPLAMLIGPALLALLGVLLGVVPSLPETFFQTAAGGIAGAPVSVELSIWHGFTPVVALSAITWIAGLIVSRYWPPIHDWLRSQTIIDQFGPNAIYDRAMVGLTQVATWQTGVLLDGKLRTYLAATFAVITTAVGLGLIAYRSILLVSIPPFVFDPIEILPLLLILASLAVVRAGSFMAGIVAAGMVGFLMAVIFLFQGAPDLAFTQFAVEALMIVILLTIVGRMPFHEQEYRTQAQRRCDLGLALSFGTLAAWILMVIVGTPFDDKISSYYNATSVSEAHGRNIVNVVIVDFRGLDTLGEITVLTLAAVAVSVLVGRRVPPPPVASTSGAGTKEHR